MINLTWKTYLISCIDDVVEFGRIHPTYLNLIISALREWGGGLLPLLLMSIGGQAWQPTIISRQLPTGLQHRRYNSHLQLYIQ